MIFLVLTPTRGFHMLFLYICGREFANKSEKRVWIFLFLWYNIS